MCNMKIRIVLFCLGLVFVMGCSKDDDPGSPVPTTGTRAQFTQDSLYLYASQIYLWRDELPDYTTFAPRSFTTASTEIDNLRKELLALTQYPVNPQTKRPYEYVSASADHPKYSFVEDAGSGSTSGRVAALSLDGTSDDFGFALTAIANNDIRVRYVTPGSAADKAGMVRGDQLVTINGITAGTSQASQINAAFENPTMSVSLRRTNGSTYTRTLQQGEYASSSVYETAILEAGSKTVGYMNLNSFTSLESTQDDLDTTFATFTKRGVTDLIIDLRYNGGGYVQTAEYLLNLIISSSHQNDVIYTERYNTLMQQGKATILSKQLLRDASNNPVQFNGRNATYADVDYSLAGNTYRFAKKGSLENVKTVCFIMTGATASASELTANALRPYLDVKIIGSQSYGKPVGFFPITIDKYTFYLSNFQISNSAGAGDYYSGFVPDIDASDDVTHNFGDAAEESIAAALGYISTGSVNGRQQTTARQAATLQLGKASGFQGMIENRIRLK